MISISTFSGTNDYDLGCSILAAALCVSREKFADIQKKDSEKLARLSSRAEEIKRLLVEQYESRGNLAAGKRTADQIILLKDYDPEIIRNFVERVRVYPSGEIEIDMRTSSGFAFVTAS